MTGRGSGGTRAGSLIDSSNTRIQRPSRRRRRSSGAASLIPILVIAALGVAFWFAVTNDPTLLGADASSAAPKPGDYTPSVSATVERVVDGDTIVAQLGGVSERVRLLNIDTPESVKPDSPVECLGPEASAFLTQLLPVGTPVTLEFDRDQRDQYDRMLAGIRIADGSLVNATIARAGFAEALEIGGNDRLTPDVDAAVAEAQTAAVGLWAPGACG